MYDLVIIDLVAWLVVFPLLLFLALLIYKYFYQKYLAYRKKVDHEEAVRRYEEQSIYRDR